ncbi:MAG: metallophosphoesterase, partial [bacterium]
MEKIKTITFGDIHGLDIWKKIADTEFLLKTPNAPIMDYDKYIFVGDYVDSFKKTNNEIYENLVEIIKFKKMYPDNVVLLWGNHDVQYLTSFKEHGCSGFRG